MIINITMRKKICIKKHFIEFFLNAHNKVFSQRPVS